MSKKQLKKFLVGWEINLNSFSHVSAAAAALRIHRCRKNRAGVFKVKDKETGAESIVDLFGKPNGATSNKGGPCKFNVLWKIDAECSSPVAAAKFALKIHRDGTSIATVFDVTSEDGEKVRVDFTENTVILLEKAKVFERVFVYGTLKKGMHFHHIIGKDPIAKARTAVNYALYLGGSLPYVTKEPACYPIIGEVYDVPKSMLSRLDGLEHHPDWYRREQVEVVAESGERMRAWLYFMYDLSRTPSGVLQKKGEYLPRMTA